MTAFLTPARSAQLATMREMAPHFEALGIDAREVIRIGRAKQIRANQQLVDELGAPHRVHKLFIRIFDAKAEWDWPTEPDPGLRTRVAGLVRAAMQGEGEIPEALTSA